ncbi:glycosyltransferase family 8 protein [Amanita thiersii Skay4041]|uniref:Glycosyltransferase family 8 protein n=1 Tax=Amanita thiersii Skay4041 TaxID=703135 RepID=A0A2A9NYN5_9AGAR|nr:glycosyltransferase family 8 protein [Amanita thiersii Skay4041]
MSYAISPPLASSLQFTSTQDWFSHNIKRWKTLFDFVHSPKPRVLEIGSWEGRSAVFLLDNLCSSGGEIVCIDHFDLFRTEAGKERFARLRHNLGTTGKPFRIVTEFSLPALVKLLEEEIEKSEPGFDWIYIDGSHEADDTFLDGELAWRLARDGAIIIFDDYHWDKEPENNIHHPKRGIDGFLGLHNGQYDHLSHADDYQVVLKKTCPMRIGFLVPEKSGGIDSGINVALAINSSYSIPAAVALRSLLEQTPGRVTIYIVNYGLSEIDKESIMGSLPLRADVTFMFLEPPQTGLAIEKGVTWAKLGLHQVLPVERVLYLDADILVRSELRSLWNTDLEGRSIGAVVDVGHPMGHSTTKRQPYFNAGVLLMDLAKVRLSADALQDIGRRYVNERYKDQDALNAHFQNDWMTLNLTWNAQGLGTYASYPSDDRKRLGLTEMDNPSIVHFTGPVNPTVGEVLNPHVQPPTAKPWGYVGAPGHPFRREWWNVLGRTRWGKSRDQARQNAFFVGYQEFQLAVENLLCQEAIDS